jgi:hypothetical protein
MNFKNWLNLQEAGTMASGVTGGLGDVAPYKIPLGIGLVRRIWPYIIKLKKLKEMASFSLPIDVKDKKYSAIDMQFELEPKTLDKDGHVMNQGSKFLAKIPDSNNYIVYDGRGYARLASHSEVQLLLNMGYDIISDDWYKKANLIENYQGQHKPPSKNYGAPLYDLLKIYPDDVYDNIHQYTTGNLELKSALLAKDYKNKPDQQVQVYRAVPKGVEQINPGDWVAITSAYAEQHSKHPKDPKKDLDIITGFCKAKELFTDGNSLAEWGYQGENKINCKLMRN